MAHWIAYVSQPSQSHDRSSMLHWFDLSEPALRFFTLYDQTGITELAFSPDTRRLAFFSRPDPSCPRHALDCQPSIPKCSDHLYQRGYQ